jgi:hypothetical protein
MQKGAQKKNALETWNSRLAEIWQLLTQSPENFKGSSIWGVIVNIHGALQAVGLALLVLFFVVGVMRTCGSLTETSSSLIGVGMAPLTMWASWNTAKMVLLIPWRETQKTPAVRRNIRWEAAIFTDTDCQRIKKRRRKKQKK